MVESAQNQAHPIRLSKIYVHTKFQLIWPLNGQENKKTHFFQNKKGCNLAKNGQKCPKSKSPNPPIKNLFSLQISAHLAFKWLRKSKKSTFLGVPITKVIGTTKKVIILDCLSHLKTKSA